MSIRLPEPSLSIRDPKEVTYFNQLIRVLSITITDMDQKIRQLEARIYELENP